MAHLIDTNAYRGATPWHGLGVKLPDDASIEQWIEAAGLTWKAELARVFMLKGDVTVEIKNRRAIYRDDTGKAFEIVSDKYQPVQPKEIVEFFRDLAAEHGMRIETAGALKGGAIVWALATNPKVIKIGGADILKPYLLLSTGYDKTHATHARPTMIRVVCNNTLQAAIEGDRQALTVPHSKKFDAADVKRNLGLLDETFDAFEEQANRLAERRVKASEVQKILDDLFLSHDKEGKPTTHSLNVIEDVKRCIVGSPGSELSTSQGTAWGVLNGVTHYVDFFARRSDQDKRLSSAWFGAGAALKADAFKSVRELVKIAA